MDSAQHKAHHACFMLLAKKTTKPNTRIGFVVAKKKVKLAVERNRIKRVVRETFRHYRFDTPLDIVFLAKKDLATLTSSELHDVVKRAFHDLQRKAMKP